MESRTELKINPAVFTANRLPAMRPTYCHLIYLHNTPASQCSQFRLSHVAEVMSVVLSHPGTLSLAKVCCSRSTSWPQIAAHTGAPPRANTAVDLSHGQTAAWRLHDSQYGVDSGRTVDKPNNPASGLFRGKDSPICYDRQQTVPTYTDDVYT